MPITELTWKNWLMQGDQYFKAGVPRTPQNKFGTEIRYNLLSMALESYIMAILDFHHTLPDNHTFTDLINALEKVITIDSSLKNKILKYENIQSICSIEKFHISKPTEEDLSELKEAIEIIGDMAHEVCHTKV
ncbi:MAG: hypothetical protein ACOCVN_01540 [bacterium]